MRVLMVLFSFLFSNVNLNNELNIKTQYEEAEFIEYSYGNYEIREKGSIIEIYYNNTKINLINDIEEFKIIYHDTLLVIFYKQINNNNITFIKYKNDKINITKKIDNPLTGGFDVVFWNNNYLLVSTINEYHNDVIKEEISSKDYLKNKNGVVLLIDQNGKIINCKIYGGELDDCFDKIYLDDYTGKVFITGFKKQNSGYDFGNGGNKGIGYILFNIDNDLNITKYGVFDYEIKNLIYNEFVIDVFTEKEIISLDYDLNMCSSLKIDDNCIFGMKMNKCYYAILTRRELKIYDYDKNKIVYNNLYDFQIEVDEIKVTNDYIYFIENDYIIKSIFYNDIYSNRIFIYDDLELMNISTELEGLPKSFYLKNIMYDDPYDSLIYGTYDVIFDYDQVLITSRVEVLKRCNVSEGYIYPTGYKLLFSGKGYLNGEEIYNNHQINKAGSYKLILEGFNETTAVDFIIEEMDITFIEENNKNWDVEVRRNQEFVIDLYYDSDVKIEEVYVNDKNTEFRVNEKNNTIEIVLSNDKIGTYNYIINKIKYSINEQINEYIMDYKIVVRVINDKINIEKNYYNNEENFIFNTIIYDEDCNRARAIKIDCGGNIKYFSLKNNNKLLLDDVEGLDSVKFYLMYDVNGILYEEIELFELEIEDLKEKEIGVMNLIIENESLKEITLNININKSIKSINVNNENVYKYQNNNNYNLIFCSLGIIVLLFLSYKIFKIISSNKK